MVNDSEMNWKEGQRWRKLIKFGLCFRVELTGYTEGLIMNLREKHKDVKGNY